MGYFRNATHYFTCPQCGTVVERTNGTFQEHRVGFHLQSKDGTLLDVLTGIVLVTHHYCPACKKYAISCSFDGELPGVPCFSFSQPPQTGFHVPEYIPTAIVADYYEAWSILNLSPKSSATLARRCLQGMIRDFWGIQEKTLNAEINKLKGTIPDAQWNVIDSLRRIGNIGAHMEKDINTIVDIDSGEAEKLLRLIEYLFKDWYIQRFERECLYQAITQIDSEKQDLRHPAE